MLQNHLLQIVALVGMEQPLRLDAEHICDEKVKMLCGLAPAALEDTLVGQYVGYAEEDGVPAKSRTETYARTTCMGPILVGTACHFTWKLARRCPAPGPRS